VGGVVVEPRGQTDPLDEVVGPPPRDQRSVEGLSENVRRPEFGAKG
jgi:hypothetical protein